MDTDATPQPSPTPSGKWAGLTFLLGEWQATGSGEPGQAEGTFSFFLQLDGHILVRYSRTLIKPPEKTEPIPREDLFIAYYGTPQSELRAIYFSPEGHVINYALASLDPDRSVVFESLPNPDPLPAPRFRLSYALTPEGALQVEFAIAPPGGDYRPYTAGLAHRVNEEDG